MLGGLLLATQEASPLGVSPARLVAAGPAVARIGTIARRRRPTVAPMALILIWYVIAITRGVTGGTIAALIISTLTMSSTRRTALVTSAVVKHRAAASRDLDHLPTRTFEGPIPA